MTHKQARLLQFIKDYTAEHGGVSPSIDEMRAALGLKSKSGVHHKILALEAQGKIKRLEHRARTVEVVA